MNAKRKKTRSDRLQDLIDAYRASGNHWPATSRQLGQWALDTGDYEPRQTSRESLASKEFGDAMRHCSFKDPQDREVRQYHAVKVPESELSELEIYGIDQPFLWIDITTDDPKRVQIAFQQERQGILNDCVRLKTEMDSFNENYNTGEQLLLALDFSEDVAELMEPVVYQD